MALETLAVVCVCVCVCVCDKVVLVTSEEVFQGERWCDSDPSHIGYQH